uniref:ATP synthase F(1) complex subunit gamma, mitochondrial n=1 Tax=Hippocampus comes TaxID=109280 RepID=A0A3Q2YLG2_HIPCM
MRRFTCAQIAAVCVCVCVCFYSGQIRNMATLKDITIRLKSIKNIQKITKSMKMVAAAKYARAERQLKAAVTDSLCFLFFSFPLLPFDGHPARSSAEMIDKLTLTFNRTRQAVITKELIEIISGAAAL